MVSQPIAKPPIERKIEASAKAGDNVPADKPAHFLHGGFSVSNDLYLKTVKEHNDAIEAKAKAMREVAEKARLAALEAERIKNTPPLPKPVKIVQRAVKAGNSYSYGYCTWYVATQLNVPNGWHWAYNWDNAARASGYTVSSVPRVGSVAQTDRYRGGHVAVVTAISGSKVQIRDMNWVGWNKSSVHWVPRSYYVYIYV